MKIGIDARLYTQTGVGRYIRNLIQELSKLDSENQYIVYLRNKEFVNFSPPNAHWSKKHLDVPWHTIREQLAVSYLLAKDRLDIVHFPYFNIPILYPGKFVVTVHDLIVDHFDTGRASTLPSVLYKLKRIGYHITHQIGLKKACAIAVISETTKQEVETHYDIVANKMIVTYDALDSNFNKVVALKAKRKIRYSFAYILCVGNAYPHKNVEGLLHAFVRIRKKHDVKLVLAGDDGFFYPRLKNTAHKLGIDNDVVFFGNANDTDLVDLYSYAKCLVFPSYMEGFGLPNLEALACGCLPVVSKIPVFEEIWGDLLPSFDPYNINDMVSVISDVIILPKHRYRDRVLKAARRIHDFSWRITAEKTLAMYETAG